MLYIGQENELIWNGKFQVLYFYSAWMPFHQKILVMLNKIAQKYPIISFFAIDMDYFKNFRKRFDVNSVPTIIIFQKSKEIKKIIGVPFTSEIIAIFDDICVSEDYIYMEKNYAR